MRFGLTVASPKLESVVALQCPSTYNPWHKAFWLVLEWRVPPIGLCLGAYRAVELVFKISEATAFVLMSQPLIRLFSRRGRRANEPKARQLPAVLRSQPRPSSFDIRTIATDNDAIVPRQPSQGRRARLAPRSARHGIPVDAVLGGSR